MSIENQLKLKREKKREGTNLKMNFPNKKYDLIYADPAWSYWGGGKKSADRHYDVMEIEDIKNLPVNQITELNSVLCMWVTFPILPQALEVMKAWGFEYSTVLFTWVKRNKITNSWFWGCGNYTRANAEIVMLGKKGKGLPRQSKSVHQIIESPLDQQYHSRKPDMARSRILELFGDVSRIELFARTKIHGWDVWGNDEKLQNQPLEAFSQQLINKELLID